MYLKQSVKTEFMLCGFAFRTLYRACKPCALADVFQGRKNGGTGQLWVKTESSWTKVQDTHSVIQ